MDSSEVRVDETGLLCTGRGLDGRLCTRHRTPGQVVCWWHDPERVEARAQALEEQAARIRATVKA